MPDSSLLHWFIVPHMRGGDHRALRERIKVKGIMSRVGYCNNRYPISAGSTACVSIPLSRVGYCNMVVYLIQRGTEAFQSP